MIPSLYLDSCTVTTRLVVGQLDFPRTDGNSLAARQGLAHHPLTLGLHRPPRVNGRTRRSVIPNVRQFATQVPVAFPLLPRHSPLATTRRRPKATAFAAAAAAASGGETGDQLVRRSPVPLSASGQRVCASILELFPGTDSSLLRSGFQRFSLDNFNFMTSAKTSASSISSSAGNISIFVLCLFAGYLGIHGGTCQLSKIFVHGRASLL
ncbi:hypothetical protein EJB05_58018, partial [Eragrostis curvula]